MGAFLPGERKKSAALDGWRNRGSGRYCQKHGGEKADADPLLRKELVEELADVLMYYSDILLCYGLSVFGASVV